MAPEMVPYTIISRPPGCSTARCSAITVSPTCEERGVGWGGLTCEAAGVGRRSLHVPGDARTVALDTNQAPFQHQRQRVRLSAGPLPPPHVEVDQCLQLVGRAAQQPGFRRILAARRVLLHLVRREGGGEVSWVGG